MKDHSNNKTNEYLIIWIDHSSTIIRGQDIGAAFVQSGYTASDFLRIENHYALSSKEGKSFKKKLEQISKY